jgi:hypothetical protein
MDLKTTITTMKRPNRKTAKNSPRKTIALNEMFYQTGWTNPTLTASTSGTISFSLSPSLQNSSENSTIQSLFTEVKLVRATAVFYTVQASASGPLHSRVKMGTNMIFTQATFTLPTSYTQVQNLARPRSILSAEVHPVRYTYLVPPGLEFSSSGTGVDSPATPTPWAGSPGAIVGYGDGFTPNDPYFHLDWENVVYHLRGRQ